MLEFPKDLLTSNFRPSQPLLDRLPSVLNLFDRELIKLDRGKQPAGLFHDARIDSQPSKVDLLLRCHQRRRRVQSQCFKMKPRALKGRDLFQVNHVRISKWLEPFHECGVTNLGFDGTVVVVVVA